MCSKSGKILETAKNKIGHHSFREFEIEYRSCDGFLGSVRRRYVEKPTTEIAGQRT